MSTCKRRLYSRVSSSAQTRIAYAGLAGIAAIGCTGGAEPERVSSSSDPSVLVAQTPLDGATVPTELGDASGLQRVAASLRDRGYGDDEVAKLAHGNWLRVLDETWA